MPYSLTDIHHSINNLAPVLCAALLVAQEDVWALCVMLLLPLTWLDPIEWAHKAGRTKDLVGMSRPKKVACYNNMLTAAAVSNHNPVRRLIE